MSEIRVGQVWHDNDKRMPNRLVRVRRIEGEKAVCDVSYGGGIWTVGSTKIALRRFKPTAAGYRLKSESCAQ